MWREWEERRKWEFGLGIKKKSNKKYHSDFSMIDSMGLSMTGNKKVTVCHQKGKFVDFILFLTKGLTI